MVMGYAFVVLLRILPMIFITFVNQVFLSLAATAGYELS